MNWTKTLLLAATFAVDLCAQGVITTAVGSDWVFPGDGKPAKDAPLGPQQLGIAVDSHGVIFVADQLNHIVVQITQDGILKVVAGNGVPGFSGDGGPAVNAALNSPDNVAVDGDDNLFISDRANGRIRKVSKDGVIRTVVGNGRFVFSGDGGPAADAGLRGPTALTFDAFGNLFLIDGSLRVRKVTPQGLIFTVAGNGTTGFSGDGGPAVEASLNAATGLAVDAAGNLYIADRFNHRIRKVALNGIISTIAGDGQPTFSGDGGPATSASLRFPTQVAIAADGSLLVADTANARIRRVSLTNVISTVATSRTFPDGIAVDGAGTLYVTDRGGSVRSISPGGTETALAGNGQFHAFANGTPAINAFLSNPNGVAIDAKGNLYISDSGNYRIRRVDTAGRIFTVAGSGLPACSADGRPAVTIAIGSPAGVAVDAAGTLYFSDSACGTVSKIRPDGNLTIVAGGGLQGDGGPARSAVLTTPQGIALDPAGNLYIAETGAQRIRKVAVDGTISTFAGNGRRGFSGDNGPAVDASLADPSGVATDAQGNVYIVDQRDNRIRIVTPDGRISTLAGNGPASFAGDGGLARNSSLSAPFAVAVDAGKNVYIADVGNQRVRVVNSGGIIKTIAGNGELGLTGDGGDATAATLQFPRGVAVDVQGSVYIADFGNNRVRIIPARPPSFQQSLTNLTLSAASGASAVQGSVNLASSVAGLPYTTSVGTTDGGSWLQVTPQAGTMPVALQVSADPGSLPPGKYQGAVIITAPLAKPSTQTIIVNLTVERSDPPKLGLSLTGLAFQFRTRSNSSSSQIGVTNQGGGSLAFDATASTNSGGRWLSVSPASGTTSSTSPATLTVTADPSGLPEGTYTGRVSIASAATGERLNVPITMTINSIQQSILLSQTGLTFRAVAGGGAAPSQNFGILNAGKGVMNWSVRSLTFPANQTWLSVTPTSGATDAASLSVPIVDVSVDQTGLAPGDYYGQVQVTAPLADNSPRSVSIFLTVLPPGSNPGPVVRPTGLIFTGIAGSSSPGSQTVSVFNVSDSPTTFTSSRLTFDGANWFMHVPVTATVNPNQPTQIVVQPDISGLTPGIRRGVLTLLFQDGASRTVNLLLVLIAGNSPGGKSIRSAESTCVPTRLLPLLTSLGTDFNVPAAQPARVDTRVVDDCGNALVTGSVVARFSNGDPALSLNSLKDGNWSQTWRPGNNNIAQVTVTVTAQSEDRQLAGATKVTGGVASAPDPPSISEGGVISAASLTPRAPLAPGSMISIFGSRLADKQSAATHLPLDTELGGAAVLIGGRPVPLLFVSEKQINALLPYDLPINTQLQMVVQRGNSITLPEPVTVAESQPAIFTKDQSGKGQGVVVDLNGRFVEPGNPTTAGAAVIIYCAGLGAIDPPVPAGIQAPASPLSSIVKAASLSIGGIDAQVLYAGLAPGFTGLYQVNAVIPRGVPAGDAVPVILGAAGQASPTVTIAIR